MPTLEIIANKPIEGSKPLAELARPKMSKHDISYCIEHNGKYQKSIETNGKRIPVCTAFPSKEGEYCNCGGDLIMRDGHIYMQCNFKPYPFSKRISRIKARPYMTIV